MIDKSKQGKKNRLKGAAFERKVRKHLESEGWIVDKWTNNVELISQGSIGNPPKKDKVGTASEMK